MWSEQHTALLFSNSDARVRLVGGVGCGGLFASIGDVVLQLFFLRSRLLVYSDLQATTSH